MRRLATWLLLALLAVMLSPSALAAGSTSTECGPFNVPDANTTPSTSPMASGTMIAIDISACDPSGFGNTGVKTAPLHGTAVFGDPLSSQYDTLYYTNNGDGATTDTLVFGDDAANLVTMTINIGPATSPITVTPGTLPALQDGVAFSQTLSASGGTPPYTWSLASGSLPLGLSLSGNTISGTPSTAGGYTFTLQVSDNAGNSTNKGYSGTIPYPTPTITTTLPNPVRGVPYNQVLQSTDGYAPFTYAMDSGSLPAGLSLSSSGVISGIPTGSATTTFSIESRDSSNGPAPLGGPYYASTYFTLTTQAPPPLTLSPTSLTAPQAGVSYSATVTASGGVAPYSYAVTSGALPTGLVLNASTGAISGTSSVTGSYTFTITATDSNTTGAVTGSQAYSFTVTAPPPPTVANKSVNTAYNTAANIDLTGSITGVDITAVTIGTPPTHGTTSVSGETVTYTPSASFYGGTDSFTYTATNPGGTSATATVTITVGDAPPSNLVYSPNTYIFTKGQWDTTPTPTYDGASLTNCTVSPALPAGLNIDASNCAISGTPTTLSTTPNTYTVTASNTAGSTTATVTITVNDVAPSSLGYSPNTYVFTQGEASTTAIPTYAGGPVTYCTVSPALPTGLNIDAGNCAISGTPTALSATPISYIVTASNSGGSTTATVTITVGPPPAPTVANKSVTTPYNTAANIDLSSSITGTNITAVNIGTAPSHGTVSVAGETVTYTPSSTFYGGSDSFTYTATNAGGTSTPATVTITVGTPAAPTAAPKAVSTAYNTAAAIDLSGSITGVGINAVSIGTAPTHGTVSVSGETVTYTPSSTFYGGSDSFTYTATNSGGTSAPATVTITVGAPAAPTVTSKSVSTLYNTAAAIDLSGSITGVNITAVTIGTAPSHGTVSVAGETVTYTPSSTFYGGTDTFTYTATNAGGTSAPATVTVTVGTPA
ncbi:MAG TPA: putative Ig domain-containing protein, partial [Oleiagrimonas sp.]|nr:putative Ig domain-containing protein [Oleiagrimonas sp.]